jgi:hypothetical protein
MQVEVCLSRPCVMGWTGGADEGTSMNLWRCLPLLRAGVCLIWYILVRGLVFGLGSGFPFDNDKYVSKIGNDEVFFFSFSHPSFAMAFLAFDVTVSHIARFNSRVPVALRFFTRPPE